MEIHLCFLKVATLLGKVFIKRTELSFEPSKQG